MAKTLPEKCRKCAMPSAEQAQALHGTDSDRYSDEGAVMPADTFDRYVRQTVGAD